jgi:hypothetical protein
MLEQAELDRALVHHLVEAWHDLNALHFRRQMVQPSIELSDTASRLGQWRPDVRVIEMSRKLAYAQPWGVVIEVLKHEMAHQFVEEVMQLVGAGHGPVFADLCARLGIDGRAAGMPASTTEVDDEETRVLRRIAKLLALGESSNAHEAEAAMAEAQRLMLKHNVERVGRAGYGFRHIGRVTGRTTELERQLGNLLSEYFFVEAIWVPVWRAAEGKRGSVLEICGSPANLDMAEHVYAFLLGTAERLWLAYKKARGLSKSAARRSFEVGVIAGFRDKLSGERKRHRSEGLVWVGDADLSRYLRRRHPRIRWTHGAGAQHGEAHGDGRAAGRDIVLSRPIHTRGGGGRLLGS